MKDLVIDLSLIQKNEIEPGVRLFRSSEIKNILEIQFV